MRTRTAKAKASRRKPKLAKTLRQTQRRTALTVLNTLGTEVSLASAPLHVKTAKSADVERYILLLETRCLIGDLPGRLRAAVEQWSKHGGHLSRQIVPEPVQPPNDTSQLQGHRVLQRGFRLQSRAFMLTYNNRKWTRAVWASFASWVEGLKVQLGFRAWGACLEASTHTTASDGPEVVHTHAYLYWNDGVGILRRNLDDFVCVL